MKMVEVPPERRKDGGHGEAPCFDCSICLHPADEPVVTPCGHLYCGPCLHQWMRSGQPAADKCPVCKATVSEDRLVYLYGRAGRRRPCYDEERHCGHGELCFDVLHQTYQHQHLGWVLHSNAGRVIAGAAVIMLPWAFPDGRLPLPPRPVIVCNGSRWKRVEDSLHQLWIFLAVAALLCFLLI
ncbi:hypothetical protein EJB05_19111, partial [Eragrostis curvula]